MKKILLVSVALLLLPFWGKSQVEIAPFGGYMFGGSLSFYEGKLNLKDNADFGVSLIVPDVKFATDLEISYSRMDGSAEFISYDLGFRDRSFDLSTNYFQIGALKNFGTDERLQPFGSFSLGATLFSPKESDLSDTWRFSVTLGLGTKIFFTDRVGIILRGRLMMPMYFGGVGGWCGIGTGGSGCGLSLNGYATIFQGDFTGGLVFKLGK
jgi:hypothetical protein